MQAVFIGLWETKLVDKSETRQGLSVLGGHYATQLWRPQGTPRKIKLLDENLGAFFFVG